MKVCAALLIALEACVVLSLLYLYVLVVAGYRPRGGERQSDVDSDRSFAIVIPAHNEAAVIGAVVRQLLGMDYPRQRFDVHVVADHCVDATAGEARAAGAIVHMRDEGMRGRKGYALRWLLQRIVEDETAYDAVVIFDADSRVDRDFLKQMNAALGRGARAIQGRHVIANPFASTFSALADADMRLNNRIRNQAKDNLGLSARLMGDGMCVRTETLRAFPWNSAQSLTEDREYGIQLAMHGVQVRYAPAAISAGQATARWSDATGQRLRWYGGAFELQKRYLGPLLASAWRRRNLAALDHAIELVIPPFSLLCLLSVAAVIGQVGLGWIAGQPIRLTGALVLVIAASLYPLLGLALERAPTRSFRALLYGPAYAVWRVGLGIIVHVRGGRIPWVRIPRAEEADAPR